MAFNAVKHSQILKCYTLWSHFPFCGSNMANRMCWCGKTGGERWDKVFFFVPQVDLNVYALHHKPETEEANVGHFEEIVEPSKTMGCPLPASIVGSFAQTLQIALHIPIYHPPKFGHNPSHYHRGRHTCALQAGNNSHKLQKL